MAEKKRVILGVTGSIAAYKSADLIRRLNEKGFKISVVMTKEAENFITPLTLSSLNQEKVHQGMFDENDEDWRMKHILLAKEADILLIAPATANTIAKMASGLGDDLLTCIVLATKAQIIIAPAMNSNMYQNSIVQENCLKLKKYGVKFIEPVEGSLACGDIGEGHIADVEDIVKEVEQAVEI